MYGILKTSCSNNLENATRRRHQCTLCNYTAQNYGNMSRYFVNNDSVFLTMLLAAQMPQDHRYEDIKCKPWNQHEADITLDYTSAITLMTYQSKLTDSYYDAKSKVPSISLAILKKQFSKAKKVLNQIGFPWQIFRDQLRIQHQIESQKDTQIFETLSTPTSKIISTIFEHTAIISGIKENQKNLSTIGHDLGSIIYILDAYKDIEEDQQQKKFNPLIIKGEHDPTNLRNEKITYEVITFCREKLDRIKRNCENLKLLRNSTQIIKSLTTELENNINNIIYNANFQHPTRNLFSINILFPLSYFALKMLVSQGEVDAYDCCMWCTDGECCCDDGTGTTTGTTFVDQIVQIATEGGAAAAIGVGAGIAGGKILSRGRKSQAPKRSSQEQELFVDPLDSQEPIEPDKIRIEEWPDDLPEIPEAPSDKDTKMTPEIDQTNKPSPDLLSPKLPPDLVDELRDSFPEMPPPLKVVTSGFDFTNWLNKLYEDSGGKKFINLLRNAPNPQRPPEKDRISPIWKSTGKKESFWREILNRHTKEAREAAEKRDTKATEGINNMKKELGDSGVLHKVTMPLSDPTRYSVTGEGDPRVIFRRQIQSDWAKGGTKGMRLWKDGAKILRTGDKSPDLPSGVLDAVVDHSPIHKDPEWFMNITRTGAETGNVAAQKANSKFQDKYDYWPRQDSDSDFKNWLPIYETLKGR